MKAATRTKRTCDVNDLQAMTRAEKLRVVRLRRVELGSISNGNCFV